MLNKNNTYNQADELKDLAPKLSGIGKNNPFSVPDNYFEELPKNIQSRIDEGKEKRDKPAVKFLFSKTQAIVSLAAASIIIFISLLFFLNKETVSPDYFSGITIDNILQESPELIELMDDYLLVDVMLTANENLGEENFFDYMDFDSTLQTDDMIEYLSDDEIETNLFNN